MANDTGINNNRLKQRNRGLTLKLIATGECSSRIEVAKKTGLSKMSASNIINEFIDQGIIEEFDVQPVGGQGRNPIKLGISKRAPKIVGVNIFRDECVAVLCDLQLNICKRTALPLNRSNAANLFGVLYEIIDECISGVAAQEILGIGMGVVGPVDVAAGKILDPPNFYGLRDLDIVSTIRGRYPMPVYLDSQYNCAALAEKYFGNGREYSDFVFVGLANGIGSGIVNGGNILRNNSGFTSELGHVSIDWNGNLCNCGNRGCLETYAGTKVTQVKLREATGRDWTFAEFCKDAFEQPGSAVDHILLEMLEKLACGLTSFVNLFNSQAIIIGHDGHSLPDHAITYLEECINQQKLSGRYRHIWVKKSYFGREAHVRGCACSLLTHLFEGEFFARPHRMD